MQALAISPGGAMERFWRAVGQTLSRHTVLVLIVIAAITGVFAVGAGGLEFATGQDSYLDADSPIAKDNEAYQNLFGGELMVVLFTADEGKTIADLFTPANLERFAAIEEKLRASDAIESVISPVTPLDWSTSIATSGVGTQILNDTIARETDPAKQEIRQKDLMLTTARAAGAGEQSLANPAWIDFLMYSNEGFSLAEDNTVVRPPDDELKIRRSLLSAVPDRTHAVLGAVVTGNASLDELAAGNAAVKEAFEGQQFENASFIVTGTPTFLTEINDYLQGGMLTLGAIAVGVMVIILLIAFKVRWRLLPLAAMLVGVIWGFGAFAFTGTDLSLVTIAGLPILIGMGIEFAIQVHNRVEEECLLDHDVSPFAETAIRLGPPLVAATVAAVLAFVAMRISKVPMVQDFGVLLAIGIVALLVTGIAIPLAVLGARERRWTTATAPKVGWVERVVRFLGSLPKGAVIPLVIVAIAIPALGLILEDDAEIESDPINWANPSSQTIKDARFLEQQTNFSSTLGIYIRTEGDEAENRVFTDQMGAFVTDLVNRSLEENPELVVGSSLASTVEDLITVPGASALAPTGAAMLAAYEQAPDDIKRALIADDGNATQVVYQVGPSSLEERAVVVDNLTATIADPPADQTKLPSNASATPSGLAVVGVGLLDNIMANRAQLTLLAIVLVGLWLLVRYGDLVRVAMTMIPVLLAVGASSTVVALLGITLSPLTTVGGPLVVATCAEFSVLLIDRYGEERRRGLTPEDATVVASQRTGRAFFTSALTTLGGFAVLMFSSLPLLRDFGAVVTLNIALAVLSALVMVPPLVRFVDHLGWLDAFVPAAERRHSTGVRWGLAGAGIVALLVLGGITIRTASDGTAEAAQVVPVTVPATDPIATLPPPTTATTAAPTTTLAPGATTTTLPPGPAEKPEGLIAGVFYDGLVGAGVDPGVARCAADNLLSKKTEPELLAAGIANTPRPPEVDALLAQAATECGVTAEQLAAAGG